MNILYLVNSGQPGGVEQYTLDLIKGLSKSTNKLFVWCLDGPIVDWYRRENAVVITRQIRFDIDPLYIFDLVKFLKTNKIDVLHTSELKAGINGMIAAKIAKTKCCVTHVHTPISEWKINSLIKTWITKLESIIYSFFVNRFSDTEIALTDSRKQIKMKEGILAGKLVVIHNGLDFSKFDVSTQVKRMWREEIFRKYGFSDDDFILGNVSRMTREKGHTILLEAFLKLKQSGRIGQSIKLILAGGGLLENNCRDFIVRNSLENNVVVTGIFEEGDKPRIYEAIDLFVFPSEAEGFGIVLIEAMAAGKIVISSDLEVLKEVGGKDVIYFKSGSADDLTDKIEEALRMDTNLRNERSLRLKNHARKNYDIKKFVENYRLLYESIISRKR